MLGGVKLVDKGLHRNLTKEDDPVMQQVLAMNFAAEVAMWGV